MKIKAISRLETEHTRDCKKDRLQVRRNLDPSLHPFDRAREYTRALNAAKLEKLFAKPLLGALDGHSDGVCSSASSRHSLSQFVSGACDGEVRVWDLSSKTCVWRAVAHSGFVNGLAIAPDGRSFLSAGEDGIVKRWRMEVAAEQERGGEPVPLTTWSTKSGGFKSLDHHWSDDLFVTAGEGVEVWSGSRPDPISRFTWGSSTVTAVRFNPAERGLLASCGADRSVCLYDMKQGSAIRKVVLRMRSNAVAWNPQEPLNFVVANEDNCLYQFDMRKLDKALMVHKDHVGPVLDVDFSPTGREFVTGSYDRTLRIFRHREGRSREVYHTKRMQRIFCVKYSADSRFVLSGSDDTNIRIWRARASERFGSMLPREQRQLEYRESLKKRYANMPAVKSIVRHRHVPYYVKKATAAERVQVDKSRRKLQNVIKHSKEGTVQVEVTRKKSIVAQSK
jgi:WD repeat and SOF domain-containing protein 1